MQQLNLSRSDESFIVNNLLAISPTDITANSIIATVQRNSHEIRDEKKRDRLKSLTVRLLPNSIFSYLDHQEIVLAREAAKNATMAAQKSIRLAWIAIWASIIIGVVGIVLTGFQLYLQR